MVFKNRSVILRPWEPGSGRIVLGFADKVVQIEFPIGLPLSFDGEEELCAVLAIEPDGAAFSGDRRAESGVQLPLDPGRHMDVNPAPHVAAPFGQIRDIRQDIGEVAVDQKLDLGAEFLREFSVLGDFFQPIFEPLLVVITFKRYKTSFSSGERRAA